jgi:hypothetical protein
VLFSEQYAQKRKAPAGQVEAFLMRLVSLIGFASGRPQQYTKEVEKDIALASAGASLALASACFCSA